MSYFEQLGLAAPILKALQETGYDKPTPIQEQGIPAVLGGKDVTGIAQTGTGKTAAFVLPMLHRLAAGAPGNNAVSASALGAALWGQVATFSDVHLSVAIAAVTSVLLMALAQRHDTDRGIEEDMTPSRVIQPSSISPRSQSMPPAASYFAHCDGSSLMDRCTRRCSGGTGGRPPGFLGCSMHQVYVMQILVD